MPDRLWNTSDWRGDFVAILAGVLMPLSLAPYGVWGLGIVSTLALAILLIGLQAKKGLFRAWLYGIGLYGSGVSWVYVSIHDFGNTEAPLAVVLTVMFVTGLALVFALPFYLYCKYSSRTHSGLIFGFAAVWVLGEWSRSWFLTGFPWLYLGYGYIDTWLSGWAPLVGVFGLSFLAIISGFCLIYAIYGCAFSFRKISATTKKQVLTYCSALVLFASIWLLGLALKQKTWGVTEQGSASVTIVQPNIPLALKWEPHYRPQIMATLRELTSLHWDSDIIVWPEAAVPLMFHDANEFLTEFDLEATNTDTALITGILYDDYENNKYFNSILGLGQAKGIYFKQRLVPFGEYMPLEAWLRGLIAFFDLPTSIINPGPKNQQGLSTDGFTIAPYICYEVVYPDLAASYAKNANLLVTISNDAWFGDSIGPLQHFQMAQMRALESQRYLIRATNTGLSGIVAPDGQAVLLGTQFQRETIQGKVKIMSGSTPFTLYGSTPIIILCLLISLVLGARHTWQDRRNTRNVSKTAEEIAQ